MCIRDSLRTICMGDCAINIDYQDDKDKNGNVTFTAAQKLAEVAVELSLIHIWSSFRPARPLPALFFFVPGLSLIHIYCGVSGMLPSPAVE